MQFNPSGRARRNVAHHYDIDGAIYDLFLDRDRQYSCAYFTDGADLEEAQLAKKRHLAAKLAIAPGQRVLDIGSGWGGLGLYLAKIAHCDVTGVTLSQRAAEDLARARGQARACRRAVRFEFKDYRKVEGRFDRIVSVGMFEHVGVNHYGTFFRKLRELLTDDGVALIHTIGRSEPPTATNPFIAKYIFPGGYIPALSEMVRCDRALRADDHRSGDPAPALRRDTARLARAVPRQLGQGRRHPRTRPSAACGSSISQAPRPPSAIRTSWCSRSSWPSASTPCRSRATTCGREHASSTRRGARPRMAGE